jgi:hypothetical protein
LPLLIVGDVDDDDEINEENDDYVRPKEKQKKN